MSVDELIEKTLKEEKKILKEHDILEEFQRTNPWVITSVLEKLSQEGHENIPTFEEAIRLREDYLLNDLSKIYKQIKKRNPLLANNGTPEEVYFYTVKKDLYKRQTAKGLSLGDRDTNGYLVSGSNLMLEVASIDLKEFLEMYYTIRN